MNRDIYARMMSFGKPDRTYPLRDGMAMTEGVKWLVDEYFIEPLIKKILDYQTLPEIQQQTYQVYDFKPDPASHKIRMECRNEDKTILRVETFKNMELPHELEWLSIWVLHKCLMLPIEMARSVAD